MGLQRAKDWNHWFYLHSGDSPRPKKSEIAEKLGLTPAEFSKRLYPKRYQPALTDGEVQETAAMWGQTVDYVRGLFPRKAVDAA